MELTFSTPYWVRYTTMFKRILFLLVYVFVTCSMSFPQDQAPDSKTSGPTYEDTVKWIQDHIQDAGIPAWTEKDQLVATAYDDETYGVKVDGCNAIHVLFNRHSHTTPYDADHADMEADT